MTLLLRDRRKERVLDFHLGLWDTRNHFPPHLDDTQITAIENELTFDDGYSQLPPSEYWTQ
ncbi:MAG: hypothetical protein P8X96_24545 [Desulfobacteraceae bacterium]